MAIYSEEKATTVTPPSMKDGELGDAQLEANADDSDVLNVLGYKPELHRNRSMITLLFQSLAIAAIPYGEGGPLISAIYGGGPLSIFVGWIGEPQPLCRPAGFELPLATSALTPGYPGVQLDAHSGKQCCRTSGGKFIIRKR